MNKTEILIVDDSVALFDALSEHSKQEFSITYCNGENCIRHEISDGRFDAIILNFDIKGQCAFHLYLTLREIYSGPIIFVSSVDDVRTRIRGLEMGADAFILLPCDLHELELRVLKIISHLHTSNMYSVGDYEIDLVLHKIKFQGKMLKMSMKAYQVIVYLLNHPNRDITRKELLLEIWDNDTKFGNRVVDTTISTVRRQTQDGNIKSVRNVGYRYDLDDL